MLMHEYLIWNHIEKDTLEKLNKSSEVRKVIFSNLTVCVNVIDTDVYQNIAAWLLAVPEDELKELTFEDVVKSVGSYIGETGYLV
jgi:hypothetical protein